MDEIRIERGAPTDEELAALVTVLLAGGPGPEAAKRAAPVSRWARSARPRELPRGAVSWRTSALHR